MATAALPNLRMWYDERGEGDPLMLLHPGGAGVDSRALTATAEALSPHFRTYTPEQRAHGRTADVEGPITFEAMAADTISFVEMVIGQPVRVLGCSDGAIVALTVAIRRPDIVRQLAFVAGVFHHDGWVEGVLDGEPPDFLRESYSELSPDGPDHYGVVVAKLASMHADGPAFSGDDLGKVRCRTLIMVGDDDEVRLEHAVEMYRRVRRAELAVVPGTSHGLLVEKPELCAALLVDFLTKEPVQTFAPRRRTTMQAS
jgi:pimeloyl-ACP methyl ester carboxylesterase